MNTEELKKVAPYLVIALDVVPPRLKFKVTSEESYLAVFMSLPASNEEINSDNLAALSIWVLINSKEFVGIDIAFFIIGVFSFINNPFFLLYIVFPCIPTFLYFW